MMVRGLELPRLLVQLMAEDRWRHPGDLKVREVMPWFHAPLVFLKTTDSMSRESSSLDRSCRDEWWSRYFRERRGEAELPWLDVERAFFVAVNRIPGDDVGIALDYRSDPADPSVVAIDVWSDEAQGSWRSVAPTFSSFAETLGLLGPEPVPYFAPGDPDGPAFWGWSPQSAESGASGDR